MKKTKKLALIFGVALILFGPLFSLIPPISGTAAAVTNTSASVEQQVESYIYVRAIASCLLQSGLRDGASNSKIDEGHTNSYEWFSTNPRHMTGLGLADTDDHNGVKGCPDSNWMKAAFTLWGWTNPDTAACYSGMRRTDQPEGTNAADCINATGEFARDGTHTSSKDQFLKNVNKQFYGKENSTELPKMTDAMLYYYYSQSFYKVCGANNSYEVRSNPEGYSDNQLKDDHLFKIYNGDKDDTFQVIELKDKDKGSKVVTRSEDSLRTDTVHSDIEDYTKLVLLSCGELVAKANQNRAAYAAVVDTGIADEVGPGASDSGAPDMSCGNFSLNIISNISWIVCGLVAGLNDMVNKLENVIVGALCISESDIFGSANTCGDIDGGDSESSSAFHNAWNAFRILALGILVIAGLVMVISQGLGLEIFDAYTVKKTLPRLLVAAIGITLSWQIMEFLVTLSNGLGIGVRNLIYAPFWEADMDTSLRAILGGGEVALNSIFGIAAGGVGLALLGPMGLFTFLLTAALAAFIAFLVLVIRNIIVIMLILSAPIAMAAYVLPNTEKYWKIWWDWTIKALMAFPIITAFIAIGHVMAAITVENKSGGVLYSVIAFIAYFAPYFMIPLAFRFAGGLMATLGGFANDRSRGGFDRLKKHRATKAAYNGQRMKDGERFNNAAMNRVTARATTKRMGFGAQGQAAYEQKLALAGGSFAKSAAGEALQHNDSALRALTYENEAQARLNMARDWGMGKHEIDESIASAKASGGFGRNRQVYAAKQLSMTGTGYDNLQQVAETVARVSDGNEGMINDLAGSINSTTKAQGRFDLAPGYDNLVGLSQGATNGSVTPAQYHQASVAASRGVDATTILRGKPSEVKNLTQSLAAHAAEQQRIINTAPDARTKAASTDEFLKTMGQIEQLKEAKSFAGTDNQEHVNALLDVTEEQRNSKTTNTAGQKNTDLTDLLTPPQAFKLHLDPSGPMNKQQMDEFNRRETLITTLAGGETDPKKRDAKFINAVRAGQLPPTAGPLTAADQQLISQVRGETPEFQEWSANKYRYDQSRSARQYNPDDVRNQSE